LKYKELDLFGKLDNEVDEMANAMMT
jgi:hypothetical protein